MHDLDAVRRRAHAAQLLDGREQLAARATSLPTGTSPGACTSTNGTSPAPTRFLSRSSRPAPPPAPRPPAQPAAVGERAVRAPDRGAQPCPTRRSAASSPRPDGLAVAVALVAGRRLDRVADRVPEVEHLPAPSVTLVVRRRSRAWCARTRGSSARRPAPRAARAPRASPPAIRAVLSDLHPTGAQLSLGSVASVSGSTITPAGWW